MSTAPNAVAAIPEVPPNISQGLTLLAKKLLPAKLNVADAAGKKNGHVFNSWAIAKGLRLPAMTAQAIAEEFYCAVQADCGQRFPQLVWDTPPRALAARVSQAKPAQVGDNREASSFEQKVRAGEKAAAAQEIQDEAKAEALEIVGNFRPLNHRSGRPNYTLEAEKKAEWRKRIAEHKGDFVTLKKQILQEQRKLYEAAEKAAERV